LQRAWTAQAGLTLDDVRRAMQGPRPGLAAMLSMAPRYRTLADLIPKQDPKLGGVLILLYPLSSRRFQNLREGGELHFVLTRRTETVANHRGQVSLPGGAREPGDTSLEETARRETCEELGITLDGVEMLGALTPLYTPPSGYLIHPFVAHTATRPAFQPDPAEVAELIEVSLSTLLDPAARQEEEWQIRDIRSRVPFFRFGEHKVWGATGMILAEFAEMLMRQSVVRGQG